MSQSKEAKLDEPSLADSSVDIARLYLTLDVLGDGVVLVDNSGCITYLNTEALQLSSWSKSDAIGLPVTECLKLMDSRTGEPLPLRFWCELTDKPSNKTIQFPDNTVLFSKDGQRYDVSGSLTSLSSLDNADQGYAIAFRNITSQQAIDQGMLWHATHDALTGLANRTLLVSRFKQAMQLASRSNTMLAVCLIDLDNFKPINDQFGHQVGDDVLLEVSARLERSIREGDTVARLGGDEFVLLLGGSDEKIELYQAIERIRQILAEEIVVDEHKFSISCSIGVSMYPEYDVDSDTLIRYADQAMYQAKQAGRNRVHWFDNAEDEQQRGAVEKLVEIEAALVKQQFELYYQPQVNMRSGAVVGMEALIRWNHPQKGQVMPLEFLPLIEQHDLIIGVGDWVIKEALQQLSVWQSHGKQWTVSINIAARHLHLENFVGRLKALLEHYPTVNPSRLEIEILESVALTNLQRIRQVISECQALGVSFALDDFGTGYSSLGYLKRLPIDTIKVDQSFIRDILDDKDDLALVQAISGLAATFGKKVIAEGVETVEHGALVMRLGCDIAQGYGIARPMPASNVMAWASEFVADSAWGLWSGMDWDLKDYPLLVAQHDIREWVQDVIGKIENQAMLPTEVRLSDESHCRFGMWYKQHGQARYGSMAIFKAIDPIHHDFHRVGDEILRLYANGETKRAIEKCQELHGIKETLLTMLDDLQIAACSSA